jgi:predicted TIM-barrel fold metal-dependent hydrolase
MGEPVVDSHLHVWSEDTDRYPRSETPFPAPPELLLEYMEEAGVDRAVFVLSNHYGYDNRYLVDTLRAYGGRLAGVGAVDPRPADVGDRLVELIEAGVHSVRIRGTRGSDAFCQPESEPLWRAASELGVSICVLCGPHQIGLVPPMVAGYPEVTVVIDHFAGISVEQGIESAPFRTLMSLARYPNTYLKLSGLHYWGDRYPFPRAQEHLKVAYQEFGPARLIWGTDWPHIMFGYGYVRCANLVRRDLSWLSEADKAQIMGGTAHRLWWPNE